MDLVSLLDFKDLPHLGTGFNGKGTPDGFIAGSQLHLAWKNEESGEPISIKSYPQAKVILSGEGMALSDILPRLFDAHDHKASTQRLTYYGLPHSWYIATQSAPKSQARTQFENDTATIIKAIRRVVDAVQVDCHNYTQIPYDQWRREIKYRYTLARMSGLPVELVWEHKWTFNSADKVRANQPLTFEEAWPRIAFLQSLDAAALWLMGGGRTNPDTQRWELTSMAEYADMPQTLRLLTLLNGKAA